MNNAFAIEPFSALRLTSRTNDDGGIVLEWKPCRVIGIAAGETPEYVVEIRDDDGSFYIATTEEIRKPQP